jgi:hypothetical protein
MKITLTKPQSDELSDLREQLKSALKEIYINAAELDRLSEMQTKLSEEISTLESAAESEDAAAKLSTKRVQREHVEQKLTALNNVTAEVDVAMQGAILDLLRQFSKVAAAATKPVIEAYAAEIAAQIRPWCVNDTDAKGRAYTLPACMLLSGTYTRRFGDFGLSVPTIKAAIARADEILNGTLAWTFETPIKK